MNCTECGHPLGDTAKFCIECGAKVQRSPKCGGCGTTLTVTAKYCPECGTAVALSAMKAHSPKGEKDRSGSSTYRHKLDSSFYLALKDAFDKPIFKTLEGKDDHLHDLIRRVNPSVLSRDLASGIRDIGQQARRLLRGVLSDDDLLVFLRDVDSESKRLTLSLRHLLDDLAVRGNRVLEEVPEGVVDRLRGFAIKAASNIAQEADGWMSLVKYGPTVKGFAETVAHEFKMQKNRPIIVDQYLAIYEDVLERIDLLWEELYEFIHMRLKDNYDILVPSNDEMRHLLDRYVELIETGWEVFDGEEEDLVKALDCAEKAMVLCPGENAPHILKAVALADLERWDLLDQTFEELSRKELTPGEKSLVLYVKGCALVGKEDFDAAVELLKKVLKAVQEDEDLSDLEADCLAKLALCHVKKNQKERGLKYLEEALMAGLDPDDLNDEEAFTSIRKDPDFESLMRNRIPMLITRYLVDDRGEEDATFRPPDALEKEQLANAKKSYVKLSSGEEIVCLYDSTIFSTAKEGICFTNRGIHWKESFAAPCRLHYDEITSVEWDNFDIEFRINGQACTPADLRDKEAILGLLSILCPSAEFVDLVEEDDE